MIKVLFVCHGNICRSPMAEYLFKDMVKKNNLLDNFYIESCATSSEEIGNPIHYGTKRILNSLGIDSSKKRARRITKEDYDKFDYIILMDEENRWGLKYIIPSDPKNKIHTLLSYAGLNRDIKDPWYTGNFTETYNDIMLGLNAFYKYLTKE
ncbi:protein-tyrosine phosphatase [Anaeroplasma bactoclasticum]|jgi:protein-tyrosine phosphatase|uniref:protein-tyrosine-phosphatase n=1 Tax=Anaeroplasma bactoclasticum TaxID=2088 RepID=A0A397QUM2_9MOLU|nr:low molecular weight protein-tyrosine-phosphatase [Anaeroplasma bactoclasticum]RIA64758.1 protein-tyrosine phosphatase [Anaeroplasma bactoclasticum]